MIEVRLQRYICQQLIPRISAARYHVIRFLIRATLVPLRLRRLMTYKPYAPTLINGSIPTDASKGAYTGSIRTFQQA
jgi:hypothetical protein